MRDKPDLIRQELLSQLNITTLEREQHATNQTRFAKNYFREKANSARQIELMITKLHFGLSVSVFAIFILIGFV